MSKRLEKPIKVICEVCTDIFYSFRPEAAKEKICLECKFEIADMEE